MIRKVLGIDVASSEWSANGSATVEFDDAARVFTNVYSGAISWPSVPLTPSALANAIDEFAKRESVIAVSLDGPQGWRDPATPLGTPGVGRRCEYECRTQGKTGTYPRTFPGNQRGWIEFSITLFEELLAKPGVGLADSIRVAPSTGRYVVLECFPTSAWRSSGLVPLPAKRKNPSLAPYVKSLAATYKLPSTSVSTHDDLQALVAALTAAGAVGGPVVADPRGVAASLVPHHNERSLRVEGLIWNVKPLVGGPTLAANVAFPGASVVGASVSSPTVATVCVTAKVVDQVNRAGPSQMQIALSGVPGGTKRAKVRVSLRVWDEDYELVIGDSNAAWITHQHPDTEDGFERMFALLADQPGKRIPVSRVVGLGPAK